MRRPRGHVGIVLGMLTLSLACDAGPDLPRGEERTTEILRARTRGLALLQQDRLEEARSEFQRLADLAPDESAGPANLALVSLRAGEIEAAERLVREALSREPDDPAVRLILAKVLEVQGRDEEARGEHERVLEIDPENLPASWALAGGSSEDEGFVAPPDRVARLTLVIERAPTGLPARFELVESFLLRGEPNDAAAQLEEIRALLPEFPAGGAEAFDLALEAANGMDAESALQPARRLHDLLRVTSTYQAGLERLRGPLGAATGFPTLAFSYELRLEVPDEAAVLTALRFRDATEFAGLEGLEGSGVTADEPRRVVAVGDFDGDGDEDLYAWLGSDEGGRGHLLRNDLGRFVDVTSEPVGDAQDVRHADFSDYDSDGLLDLYLVRDGANRLLHNLGDGRFEDVSDRSGAADAGDGLTAVFADIDHDGDLDLVVANREGSRMYRGDGTGGFAALAGAMAPVDDVQVIDMDFGDFDDDGDLDLVVAGGQSGVRVVLNQRQDVFTTAVVPPEEDGGRADAVAVGDYDNDGHPDLVVAAEGSAPTLYRGQGDGRFEPDARSVSELPASSSGEVALLDFDNDGYLDLALSTPGGLTLYHNDGRGVFEDLTAILPAASGAAHPLAVLDYNEDGDLDVLAGSPTGLRLLRNDGGNLNHHVSLSLVARGPGSGKVNRFAIGSTLEIRAGDLYQSRTVRDAVTHIGLGSRLKADVIRILWTNGVPQYLYFPGTDQDLLETQELKGSCAFVYAWDGEGYDFVTDAMWRSAIGMPLGIMGGGGTSSNRIYAPPASSREYIRIPGERLRPHEGRYLLQLTEELWEVAYIDEVKLLAIDHPDSVELFVDEKFIPPAPPHLGLYRVAERLPPVSASDGRGNDVLPTLAAKDARYVSNLRVDRYQGIVVPHEIVLELPAEAVAADQPYLFLQGWIFPSDASINVAVSQADDQSVMPPRLEVPDGRGGWRTAIRDIGFPSGKDKTVVVDLGGVVRHDDPRIRIRTNVQVYWDHAFFAAGEVAGPSVAADAEDASVHLTGPESSRFGDLRVQLLRPVAADLHYRGFSREYRRGGRHGPHWFDYDDVSAESPWLPIRGRYTRYGNVLPLLGRSDDMYSVMAPGDEMTVEFDASVTAPPDGWSRTFLLYTDGWIKDADINTATGNTVAPLPFHAQSEYPYGPSETYPSDAAHRAYLERYQTREVGGSTLGLAPRSRR